MSPAGHCRAPGPGHPTGHGPVVSSLDLLRALLDEGENLAVRLMVSQGADVDALAAASAAGAPGETPPAVPGPDAALLERLTMPARLACAAAMEAVLELGHNYSGCEHLLIGLATGDSRASELLASQASRPRRSGRRSAALWPASSMSGRTRVNGAAARSPTSSGGSKRSTRQLAGTAPA